jgi:ECF sigma factor
MKPACDIHEACLRLIDWRNSAHFFGMEAQMMRRILVDYAIERKSLKRGGTQLVTLKKKRGGIFLAQFGYS